MNTSFYKEIISKLELLVKKEYFELLLFGLCAALIITIGTFTVFSLVEMIAYFNSTIRTVLFFIFLLISIGAISYLIVLPLLKYFNLIGSRNYFYSASKVGKYFPEIKDDLLNAMQLVSSDKTKTIYLSLIHI